jgi:plasmid stabilization system protein ParE
VSHRIECSPEALGDLIDLYDYIALRDGPERAIGDIGRIENCCRSLSMFPTAASGAMTCAAAHELSVSNAAQ